MLHSSKACEYIFSIRVYPDDLHSGDDAHTVWLPSIAAWFNSPVTESESIDDNDDDNDNVVDRILDDEESSPISH